MIRTPWLLAMVALVLSPAFVTAQETYAIKVKTSGKGDVGIFAKEENEANNSVILKDGKVIQEPKEITKRSAKYKEEILEKQGDKAATKLRRMYEKATVAGADGAAKNEVYAGKTVLIEVKDGKPSFRIEGGAELSYKEVPSLVKEFAKGDDDNAKMNELLLPKKPVAVGESWSIDKEVIKKLLGKADGLVGDPAKGTATGKLVKAYKKGGRQYGVLQYEIAIPVDKLAGLQFAAGTRLPLTLTADVCIDGSADAGTVSVRFAIKGEATAPGGILVRFDVVNTSVETRAEAK